MIEQHLINIEKELELIREKLKPVAKINDAYWQDGKIIVEYENSKDILYGFGDKVFSVANNVDSVESSGTIDIGVNKYDRDWWVRPVGDEEGDDVIVGSYKAPEKSEPVTDFWHGLWDSWHYGGDEFNTTKVKSPDDAIGLKGNIIVSLSHRWKGKTRQQWQSILDDFESVISRLNPEKTKILLQDEPLGNHHGFSLEDVQFLYDTAKQIMPAYEFGFSFVRSTIANKDLPNCDFVILPTYPFFREDYPDIQISTKSQFDKWFDEHIAEAKNKHSGDIFVIGQGFYNTNDTNKPKWRTPSIEAPKWYAEAIERNALNGLLWWVYSIDRDGTIGLETMPEYFNEIKAL